jgi:hypothetical protein
MVDLISLAWGVDGDKVLSGPNWLDLDRFDVIAIAPGNATPETVKTMLQSLLAERFKLVVHADKKEMPTYALTAGKKPQLKEADGSGQTGCNFEVQGMGGGRGGPAAVAPGTTFSDAIEKQLGLKLEPRKVPIPVIVVESANEKPTDNLPGVTEKLPVAPTEFEVADIKPSDPNATPPTRSPFLPGGRLDLRGMTLKNLIVIAWDTMPNLVVGGPNYADTDKYEGACRGDDGVGIRGQQPAANRYRCTPADAAGAADRSLQGCDPL